MDTSKSNQKQKQKIIFLFVIPFIIATLLSCSLLPSNTDNSAELTSQAISVQQTLVAQQSEQQMQSTIQAQQTIIAGQSVSETQAAQQPESPPTEAIVATQEPQQPPAEPPTSSTEGKPQIPDNFDELIKSADIVLYEDMNTEPKTLRYVKAALDNLGLNYKDDGNAKGWYKSDLLGGAPDGEPWDLIIMASEARSGMSGEFFDYLNKALNDGSSVIIETWYLDQVANGKASNITSRCGFAYQKDWVMVPIQNMVMFPLDPTNPILHRPNDGLKFSDIMNYWESSDVGDLIKLTGKGDAKLLLGTVATDKTKNGTVAVCLDGKLIWQTFCSHNLSYDDAVPLWENYIYNALAAKLLGD